MSSLYLLLLSLVCLVSTTGGYSTYDPPDGRFQLRNPQSGFCAVVQNDSDAYYAKIVAHKCSCNKDDYQYWTLDQRSLVSEGKWKQCMSNWVAWNYPGATQYKCQEKLSQTWRFKPLMGGDNFHIVSDYDGQCVYAPSGPEDIQISFEKCDAADPEQEWVFYDECSPSR